MNLVNFSIPLGKNRAVRLPVLLWFTLVFAVVLKKLYGHSYNNYLIFKGVFWHTIDQSNLFSAYPAEHFDVNHYGPFFSVIIAPFALLPADLGVVVWCLLNAFVLFYAIRKLPVSSHFQLTILLIAAIEMMTSLYSEQINPMLAGWFILAFVLTEKGKDFWATLFIAAGFMIKIYGIAGLLFFVFSKNKLQFGLSFIFWVAVMFFLPMLFSSPAFIIHSYSDWWQVLVEKNIQNTDHSLASNMQDISVMGFIRRIFQIRASINLFVLVPAALMIVLPLLRFQQYKFLLYRLSFLAIALISVVIFSTSAESPSYVIAVTGAALWYTIYPHGNWSFVLLLLLFLLTILSPTDLFPKYIKVHYIKPYSLKALPCILIWLILIRNVAFKNFSRVKSPALNA